jgi:hypothetical protein
LKPTWFHRYILHNLGLKLFALAAATVLWALTVAEPAMETTVNVPIEFHNAPPDLEILWDQPPTVHVQVKGPQSRVRTLAGEVAVVLDLLPVQQPGGRTFPLDSSRVLLPRGMSLVRAMPSQVRLVFERRLTRDIRVLPRFTGVHQPGYEIGAYTVDPPALKVVGPVSRVALLDFVMTDPIDVSSLIGSGNFATTAYLEDANLRFENIKTVRVQVAMRRPPESSR